MGRRAGRCIPGRSPVSECPRQPPRPRRQCRMLKPCSVCGREFFYQRYHAAVLLASKRWSRVCGPACASPQGSFPPGGEHAVARVPCSEENEAYPAVATLLRRYFDPRSKHHFRTEPADRAVQVRFLLRAAVSRGGGDAIDLACVKTCFHTRHGSLTWREHFKFARFARAALGRCHTYRRRD